MKQCFECDSKNNLIEHHVVPRSRGGKRTIVLCQPCHDKVHGHKRLRNISVSELTSEGLKRAKERGVKLGNPNPARALAKAMETSQRRKKKFYDYAIVHIREIQASGISTLQGIADALNSKGVLTSRGKLFSEQNVFNVINTDPTIKQPSWTATAVKRVLDV